MAARNGEIDLLVLPDPLEVGERDARSDEGKDGARLYQKKICTSTGVPRKNQM